MPVFKPEAAVGSLGLGTFYDVAPDGRVFCINILVERTSPPATVVLN